MIRKFLKRICFPELVVQSNIKTTGNIVAGDFNVDVGRKNAWVSINGKKYSGGSIEVRNFTVYVDGKKVSTESNVPINIEVSGDIVSLKADQCDVITVKGNCGSVDVQQGDVSISGDIGGNATTQM